MSGNVISAWINSPARTVTIYIPSLSPTAPGSSKDRILPVTRNIMPTGEYLKVYNNRVNIILSQSSGICNNF
jgi:hypothetical protein